MKDDLIIKMLSPPLNGKADAGEWDKIVQDSENGYFTQLYEWMEICSQSLGLEAYPLAGYRNNELSSVFPLVYDKGGKQLQSPALTGIGGPTITDDLPSYLIEIKKLAKSLSAQSVKIQMMRNDKTMKMLQNFSYNTDFSLPYYVLDLSDVRSFEELKKGVYDRNARRGLKQSIKNKVDVVCVETNRDNLMTAYEIYRQTMEFHGEEKYLPGEFFESIAGKLGDVTALFNALHNGRIVGTAVCFIVNNRLKTWFILGKIEERSLYVNYALYSRIIRYALSNKIKLVDFGPSAVFTRAHEIKVKHGGREQWIVTGAWFNNPARRMKYALSKRLRLWSIAHPESKLSGIYREKVLSRRSP